MIFIHVIGLVGAGKTTFINKHLSTYPCFDIQSIYTRNQIIPENLKHPEEYRRYYAILSQTFEDFVHQCQSEKGLIGIIESSGANHGLNQLLRKHLCYSIWIRPDLARLQDPEFIAERPYAPDLNTYLLELYTKRRLHRIDLEFDPETLTFHPKLPAPLRSIFPEFRPFHRRMHSRFPSDTYPCPECGAIFSKPAYLQLHFTRMPHHQHPKWIKEKKPLELGAISHGPRKFLS